MDPMKDRFAIHKDFPKEGVSFVDINPVLNNSTYRENLKSNISFELDRHFKAMGCPPIDKVVAVESRGFIFGGFIADELEAGLVLARKAGKLPGKLVSEKYGTEYSDDKLEMQLSSIAPNDYVVIHDDVLATGGTVLAVKKMVEKLGGIVVGYSFLAEIEFLKGREVLGDTVVSSILYF